MKCERCGGSVVQDLEEGYCINCGWRKPPPEVPPPIETPPVKSERPSQYSRDYAPLHHYSKVSEKLPGLEKALSQGIGVRQASREFNVSINTVRGIVRKNNKASQAQKVRREKEKEGHWLQFALKGLAVHSDRYTSEEMQNHAMALLAKYMKGNQKRTVRELIPEVRRGAAFNADDLIKATLGMMVGECLNYWDTFEHVGDGAYKLRRIDESAS